MRRYAFTLVQVLVVIGILAVLAGVLFPVFQPAYIDSKYTACAYNLRQLGTADHLYANDHDGWVPPATSASETSFIRFNADPATVAASPSVLRASLDPYVKSASVWFCPTDPHAHQNVLWLGQRHLLTSYWIYPVMDGTLGHNWPPRMQLTGNVTAEAVGVPLVSDAVGIPDMDSDPKFASGDHRAYSNHPNRTVNVINHDLSITRKSAAEMMGTPDN